MAKSPARARRPRRVGVVLAAWLLTSAEMGSAGGVDPTPGDGQGGVVEAPGSTSTSRVGSGAPADHDRCRRLPHRYAPEPSWSVEDAVRDVTEAREALARATELAAAASWSEARQAYQRSLSLDPSSGLAHLGLAEALAYLGGRPVERRQHLAAALLELPKNPRAHTRFADALIATGSPAEGLAHLRCALELKPNLREARRRAAHLALELEGPEAAEVLMDGLLAPSAQAASDLVLVAQVRAEKGELEAAAEAMTRAAQSARSAPLFRRAADLWRRAGLDDRAEASRAHADVLAPPPESRSLRPLPDARVRRH